MNEGIPMRRHLGIRLKTALLSWAVTIVTLSIFLLALIPTQKKTILKSLESNAKTIAASLSKVTSAALVSGAEDYQPVQITRFPARPLKLAPL